MRLFLVFVIIVTLCGTVFADKMWYNNQRHNVFCGEQPAATIVSGFQIAQMLEDGVLARSCDRREAMRFEPCSGQLVFIPWYDPENKVLGVVTLGDYLYDGLHFVPISQTCAEIVDIFTYESVGGFQKTVPVIKWRGLPALPE